MEKLLPIFQSSDIEYEMFCQTTNKVISKVLKCVGKMCTYDSEATSCNYYCAGKNAIVKYKNKYLWNHTETPLYTQPIL